MATRKKSTAVAKAATGQSLATIDAELANEVMDIKSRLGQPAGNQIKIEVAGRFTDPSGADLGDEIQVVVVDFVSRNNLYLTEYDPNSITPPDCYAIGKARHDQLVPEDDSPSKQSEDCSSCPMGQWGSGKGGRGKACGNRYLVAVLVVDPDDPEAHNAPDAPLYTINLSPTNLKSFDGFASGVARSLNGPPIKAIGTVVAENAGTFAKVYWNDPIPNPDYAAHAARRGEAQDILFRKPDFTAADAAPAQGRGRAAAPKRRTAAARR